MKLTNKSYYSKGGTHSHVLLSGEVVNPETGFPYDDEQFGWNLVDYDLNHGREYTVKDLTEAQMVKYLVDNGYVLNYRG